MLKKPSLLLSSYGNIQNLYYPSYAPIPSVIFQYFPLDKPRINLHRNSQRNAQKRKYADVRSGSKDSTPGDNLEWPEAPSATKIPTPYQIFKQKKGTPYNKRRFYELVKIYHPDKHIHNDPSFNPKRLSYAVKLERYRLVVTANDILSDPVKRKAYDIRGEGWSDDIGATRQHGRQEMGRGWSGFDDNASPARNATWEDWERWYQRDTGPKKQRPHFFSNGGFFAVVALCAVLGGMGEISRARKFSGTFLEQLEMLHDQSSKDLQRARKESQQFGNRDARVQSFLRTRDPVGYGVTDPQEEALRKLLPAPDLCTSGDIQARASDKT